MEGEEDAWGRVGARFDSGWILGLNWFIFSIVSVSDAEP